MRLATRAVIDLPLRGRVEAGYDRWSLSTCLIVQVRSSDVFPKAGRIGKKVLMSTSPKRLMLVDPTMARRAVGGNSMISHKRYHKNEDPGCTRCAQFARGLPDVITPGVGRHTVAGGGAGLIAEGVSEMERRLDASVGRGVTATRAALESRAVGASDLAGSSDRALATGTGSSPGQYRLCLSRENFMARTAHLCEPVSALPPGDHGLVSKAQG